MKLAADALKDLDELQVKHGRKLLREACKKYLLRNTYAGEQPRNLKVTFALKKRLWKRQKARCLWCEKPIDYYNLWECEVDHKKPLSDGGTDDERNLQLLHEKCNREKAAMTLSEQAIHQAATVKKMYKRIMEGEADDGNRDSS